MLLVFTYHSLLVQTIGVKLVCLIDNLVRVQAIVTRNLKSVSTSQPYLLYYPAKSPTSVKELNKLMLSNFHGITLILLRLRALHYLSVVYMCLNTNILMMRLEC